MGLKFGTNTIATNGDYAKFGTNNLDIVKFASTTVWQKQTNVLSIPVINASFEDDGFYSFLNVDSITNNNNVSVTAHIYAYMENSQGSDQTEFTQTINANSSAEFYLILSVMGDAVDYAIVEVYFTKSGYTTSSTATWEGAY